MKSKRRSINNLISRPFQKQPKIGKAPGSVIYLGKRRGEKFRVSLMHYNEAEITEEPLEKVEAFVLSPTSRGVNWFNIKGLSNTEEVETLGKSFGLSALTLEDIVNTDQRPKMDHLDDHLFVVVKMIYPGDVNQFHIEHVAIVLLRDTVLLFQEVEEDVFEGVRERIRSSYGRIRNRKADYLLFALLDAIVDQYFIVMELMGNKIEQLEEKVYEKPNADLIHEIQALKKEVLELRKHIRPVKELVNQLIHIENSLIAEDTRPFLRDILDHCNEIQDNIDLYREMSVSLMEIYMSNMSNKMNEVMKVLTIMASIFIPLTFIAGIYGMNFQYMPELHERYAYPMVLGVMALMVIVMLIYFKRKDWL
ncbi:magnesium/cobalt transporter CorA [Robertkochia marina]|uniref:Magnesium transport protein CorA n=1 Tax=Robertkochia marina TaxID=1227945 RepID=A0A4S3M0G4_9FLAO|nr:magnesium/cobalt transporter CorA [Robertkochia marina]THD67920.1 magnesium/cobalt transporter CorA [Robertkochia marina]TRZ41027.1 magnesium and cobalt transport protein CorA [Robertkochia marina]